MNPRSIWLSGIILAAAAIIARAQATPTTLPAAPAESGSRLSQQSTLLVRGFRFQGNTIFTHQQLASVAEPYRIKCRGQMTIQDLETVRTALTLLYVNNGCINSGALLPEQTIGADGIVLFNIVEGRLTTVHVTHGAASQMPYVQSAQELATTQPSRLAASNYGPAPRTQAPYNAQPRSSQPPPTPVAQQASHRSVLSDSYVSSRVLASAGPPLNLVDLRNRLELLREDPNIKTINAELKPGDVPGEAELDLAVTERNPFQFGVNFANDRSPSVGAYRLQVLASDSDLSGNGDSLSAHWGVLEGAANDTEFSGGDDYGVDYAIPLTANDLTLLLDYTRSSDLVVEAPFSSVNITSKTDSLAATLRQPLVRDLTKELAGFFTVSSKYNRTFLLGQPFSFSPGAENGESDVFALRFGPEYTHRSENDALALRGTVSVGIDGPKSTLHGQGEADSRFFAFLGQFQYTRRVPLGPPQQPLSDTQAVFRFNTQLTPNPLLSVEQFSLGGVDTVRGYRENQFVTDNAVNASVELRMPVVETSGRAALSFIPFIDSGYAWDVINNGTPDIISSVGLGLAYTPNDQIDARIYWGIPFKHFPHATDDLQDMGLHFSVTILAF